MQVSQNAGRYFFWCRKAHRDSRKNDLFQRTCWRRKCGSFSGTAV
ncbi:hypothetical protein SGRIM128S_05479 [Streptomyces griseomycini]